MKTWKLIRAERGTSCILCVLTQLFVCMTSPAGNTNALGRRPQTERGPQRRRARLAVTAQRQVTTAHLYARARFLFICSAFTATRAASDVSLVHVRLLFLKREEKGATFGQQETN